MENEASLKFPPLQCSRGRASHKRVAQCCTGYTIHRNSWVRTIFGPPNLHLHSPPSLDRVQTTGARSTTLQPSTVHQRATGEAQVWRDTHGTFLRHGLNALTWEPATRVDDSAVMAVLFGASEFGPVFGGSGTGFGSCGGRWSFSLQKWFRCLLDVQCARIGAAKASVFLRPFPGGIQTDGCWSPLKV